MEQKLYVKELVVEHQESPLGMDCKNPRFGWKLLCADRNIKQTAYQIEVFSEGELVVTYKEESEASL